MLTLGLWAATTLTRLLEHCLVLQCANHLGQDHVEVRAHGRVRHQRQLAHARQTGLNNGLGRQLIVHLAQHVLEHRRHIPGLRVCVWGVVSQFPVVTPTTTTKVQDCVMVAEAGRVGMNQALPLLPRRTVLGGHLPPAPGT